MSRSKQDAEEEKHKWAMKYFDYAEDPIKEWISAFLSEPIDMLFADYKGESDIISIMENSTHYNLYLTINPPEGKTFDMPKDELKTLPRLSKATSLLYDAVRTVFTPVVKTMDVNMYHRIEDYFPRFIEDEMCFIINMVNKLYIKKDLACKNFNKIVEQFKKLNEVKNDEGKEEVDKEVKQLREKLFKMQSESIKVINELPDDKIKEYEEQCKATNALLMDSVKLYIVLEKNVKPPEEAIMKRLIDFGTRYQDPEEDNYIDMLKKEYNVNE